MKQFGQGGVDSFMRFYMIPGFGHGFGPFNAKIDSLTALRDWVEKGEAPKGLTADRRQPRRQPVAAAVRMAEVAEVHRRRRHREQRRQLHLRRAVDPLNVGAVAASPFGGQARLQAAPQRPTRGETRLNGAGSG